MSFQDALCFRVIKHRDEIRVVLEFGITVDDFITHENRTLWQFIEHYYSDPKTPGQVPSVHELGVRTQGKFSLGDDFEGMTTQALCVEVRRQRLVQRGHQACLEFTENLGVPSSDPMNALSIMQGHLTGLIALGTSVNTDVSMLQGSDRMLVRMMDAEQGIDRSKMRFPWGPLDDETFGVQEDDYILFYGRPKSGKTWVLASLIDACYKQDKRALIYTKEMTADGIWMRTLACILGLEYKELRGAVFGRNKPMNKDDKFRLFELNRYLKSDPRAADSLVVLNGREAGPGRDTVPWLRSKIEKYRPDVVFVDGMYLLSDHLKNASDQQRVMNISRGLRDTILATRTPIIATTQANRKAAGHKEANLDEIGFSDSLGQDVTLAARVIGDKTTPTMSLVIGGSREFTLHGLRLNCKPARDFSFLEVLSEDDIRKATEGDHGEDEKKDKKPKKATKGDKAADQERAKTEDADMKYHVDGLRHQNGKAT